MTTSRAFLILICLQAAHSAEEIAGHLYRLLPYFRPFGDNAELAFTTGNGLVVLFGLWCWRYRVRRGARSAAGWAWGWSLVEFGNGLLHLLWSVLAGEYIPGTLTAPLLLACSVYLMWRLASESRTEPIR